MLDDGFYDPNLKPLRLSVTRCQPGSSARDDPNSGGKRKKNKTKKKKQYSGENIASKKATLT